MPIIVSFFLLGLSFGAGPCLASCGPLLITYLAGTGKNVWGSISSYILFSAARISVYLAIGVSVYLFGRFLVSTFLGAASRYILMFGGGFIAFIGALLILGRGRELGFCSALQRRFLKKDKKSVIIFGLVIGLLPCAPLVAVFSYLGLSAKNWPYALTYAFSFGLGTLLSPLLLLVGLSGLIPGLLGEKKAAYLRFFNLLCGWILVLLGLRLIWRAS